MNETQILTCAAHVCSNIEHVLAGLANRFELPPDGDGKMFPVVWDTEDGFFWDEHFHPHTHKHRPSISSHSAAKTIFTLIFFCLSKAVELINDFTPKVSERYQELLVRNAAWLLCTVRLMRFGEGAVMCQETQYSGCSGSSSSSNKHKVSTSSGVYFFFR